MRLQLRLALICLCIVAALAAGCSKDNGSSSPTGPGNSRSAAQCANTIGNRVWFDTNCNGLQDSLETGGPLGVTVTLRNCDTQEERTTKTDATGHYSFTDVATGSYSICIDIPDGYKATLMDQGAVDSLDSDINADGCTGCESYDCSTDNLTRAAGLCVDEAAGACTNTIGSRVWYDTNCDGIQDGNETTGPEGVKVTLRNCDTQALRTTHTDATGNYHFGNVVAGSYSICIDIPDGYKATLEDQGADDGMDSDINSEGCTGCQAYTCEASDVTRDAGICVNETGGECDNTIGSRVWYDTNCNGIQDQDETTGPEGVKVTLTNCSTQVERTTTTDASGNYHFGNVATGEYMICIDIPTGYKASLEDQGADDGKDSDINAEGCTGCRQYTCEADDVSRDAGICVDEGGGGECSNTIGNRVWYDANCNGIQDKDETGGPEGIKVILRNCDTGESRGTATDASGFYTFTDVPTGDYEICIEIPGGFAATLENQGSNDGIDSDIDTDGCTGCHHIECGSDDISRDAGLCEKKTPPDEDTQSCSPGFWRNHLTHWAATPYSPNDRVNATFGCDLVSDDDLTLGEAIDAPQTYGTLVFHAIAALLNASHPDIHFGLSVDEVMDAACAHDKETLANENEVEGCPLSGGNTNGGGGGGGDDDDDDDDQGGHGHHGGGGGGDDDNGHGHHGGGKKK